MSTLAQPPTLAHPPASVAASPPRAPARDDHEQHVLTSFDRQYAQGWGTDVGKLWYERYSPGLAPYANLVHARNARVIAHARPGDALLDVGSGYGDLLYLLRDKYRVLRGIDPSETTVRLATHNLKIRGVTNDYRIDHGVAERLPHPDATFDTVLNLDTYEHIEPAFRHAALLEARRVLKPGGRLILATPSRARLRFWLIVDNLLTLRRQFRLRNKTSPPRPIELFRLPRRDFCELFCSSRELKRDLRAAGFTIRRFERVSFYPAPERGGLLGPALEPKRLDHPFVQRTLRFVRFMERLRFFNQKMLVIAEPCGHPPRRESSGARA